MSMHVSYINKVYSKQFYDYMLLNDTIKALALEKFNKTYSSAYKPDFDVHRDYYVKTAITELGFDINSLYLIFQIKELWA